MTARAGDSMRGFLLQTSVRVERGRSRVELWGVREDGGGFCVEDDVEPYGFVRTVDVPRIPAGQEVRIAHTALATLAGEPVSRVAVPTPADLVALRRAFDRAGIVGYELDVPLAARYVIDRGIRAGVRIAGTPAAHPGTHLRLRGAALAPADVHPTLRVLSIDIETTPSADRVLSVALATADASEVHLVSDSAVEGATAHRDERALLAAVMARIAAIDPDVITGWNVVDFDLRVLERRLRAHGQGLALGRAPGAARIVRDASFSRQARAEVRGRQVLDALGLVRDAFISLPDYRLETAARTLLGRGKRIAAHDGDARAEIMRMYREDRAALTAYNAEDARLVLDILAKESLLELAVERSLLSGMPLDRVGASIAAFDRLYLPVLRQRGYVAPCVDETRPRAHVTGGAVLESTPGLFSDVAVLDFQSLYPSLIRTFNLDPLSHARAELAHTSARGTSDGSVGSASMPAGGEAHADPIVAPSGGRFERAPGILPEILSELHARRTAARARGDVHATQAIKIFMNACFGVLAAPRCRFFDPVVANAITTFGQQTLGWACDLARETGVDVLYGDTDSLFVVVPGEASETCAARERRAAEVAARAEALRGSLEAKIAERVRHEYGVEPALRLNLARIYRRFFQPQVRGGGAGSKKRYAGLVDGAVEVVGLEAVRRDWPPLARRVQIGVLERLFTDRPALQFVRDVAARLVRGELDDELVIRKTLRKSAADRSARGAAPHVEAARRAGMRELRGEIRYVMTARGPEPAPPGAPLPTGIDYAYYTDRVLRPLVDSMLCSVGESFDEAMGYPRQLRLL
jgi:DNA polymerase-2